MDNIEKNLVIIGSGSAGLTAAIYAARANLSPLVIEGLQPGGQLTITTDVENYPGFSEVIQGPWLMDEMKAQAKNVGVEIINDIVVEVDFKSKIKKIICDSKLSINTKSVIICTGAQAKWLGLQSEMKFNGKGVSACATCDGFFYKNKNVAVIGGGNTAVEEALYLSNLCSNVTLIHRRDQLRAEKILQERLFKKQNVEIIWDHTVEEILGNEKSVNKIKLISKKTQKSKIISIDGVFIAIGHDPSTACFRDSIQLDKDGYIVLKEKGTTRTSVEGVFVAGDCVDKIYRQAVTAAGMGCMAALDAEKWLQDNFSN